MRCQFYHAIVLCALIAPACSRPAADTPVRSSSGSATTPAPAAFTPGPATTTSESIRLGKEIIERVRAAAGGPKLTAMRSFQATGVSTMSVVAGSRSLTVRALYPDFYRQEEIPAGRGGLGVALGIEGSGRGWMLGGRLGGGKEPSDPAQLQEQYNRAGSQAMAGFLAGVNAPWLVDSGQFTPLAAGQANAGNDRDLLVVNFEGPLGRAGRLLVDPSTNLPRHFIEPPQPASGGEAGLNEWDFAYSDFRAVDGVQLPHTIIRRIGRVETTWSIAKYAINPKIRPKEFTRRIAANVK